MRNTPNSFRFLHLMHTKRPGLLLATVVTQDRRRRRRVKTGETSPIYLRAEDYLSYAKMMECTAVVKFKRLNVKVKFSELP